MLSGIGPADALRGHGIAPVAKLPGVGENLHDHPRAAIVYRGARPVPPAASNHGEALGLLRSDPAVDRTDLQIAIVDVPMIPPRCADPRRATRSRRR
ncbi:GMC family oxidoreductase N-terminal domain-containing protein [Streptomyces brasiliensis]|uniref:Glucose-methanol-choline oxidoreductase N-terminal domain-containing protein n=1 Tax=Streptomyces brasiliensis TaxID=1954 RepID=A0A917KT29_9ACTN|nr:GMC family oxidoreductase N-terminal domain-containing protein [Streptomyces brasiliensis]GGJ28161.1 hypothetical protein GCM10010121_044330 [Streptomyces brasiliensis]